MNRPSRISGRSLKIGVALLGLTVLLGVAFGPLSDRPPEGRVAAYLEATARGDEPAGLAAWQTWPQHAARTRLQARRADLTRELASLRVGQRFTIGLTEWWRTCCEPGTLKDGATPVWRGSSYAPPTNRGAIMTSCSRSG